MSIIADVVFVLYRTISVCGCGRVELTVVETMFIFRVGQLLELLLYTDDTDD